MLNLVGLDERMRRWRGGEVGRCVDQRGSPPWQGLMSSNLLDVLHAGRHATESTASVKLARRLR